VRRLPKKLAGLGLPIWLQRPARNRPKTPPIAKSSYAMAFFDSIGQNEKNSA
jgi:hypothetical protein